MRLLLDTNIVIRLGREKQQINEKTRRIIGSATAIYVSAASIWEITIKLSARKLDLVVEGLEDRLLDTGIEPLPITWTHARRACDIASFHPDPFDRLLLAQAVCEPLHLLTSDRHLAQYAEGLVIAV
jgi:PIN domain nuclease of toxin-antitoxin system